MEIRIDINPEKDINVLCLELSEKFGIDFTTPGNYLIPTIDGKDSLLVITKEDINIEELKNYVKNSI